MYQEFHFGPYMEELFPNLYDTLNK